MYLYNNCLTLFMYIYIYTYYIKQYVIDNQTKMLNKSRNYNNKVIVNKSLHFLVLNLYYTLW